MRRRETFGPGGWMVLGFLVVQATWLFVVPPFAGMDEWDHAYRAAAVADGQWRAEPSDATRGTGAVLDVPADVVEAASEECAGLPYTTAADCVGERRGDRVRVASGAGRYHPAFYALVGYPTASFEGVQRLWAMRVVATLACAGLFALAVAAVGRWRTRSRAIWASLMVAVTPTVAYTTVVAAPNGVEIMAGLAWSAALIGLATSFDGRHDRYLLAVAAVAGAVLVTVRSLGPLWCALAVVTCLVVAQPSRARVRGLLARPAGRIAVAVVALATLLSAAWVASQRALELGDGSGTGGSSSFGDRLAVAATEVPTWLIQAIGAFPYRNEPAPFVVAVVWFVAWSAVVGPTIRWAGGATRWAVVGGWLLVVALPFAVTVATMDDFGLAWQGRYWLPYAGGLVLVSGLLWARHGPVIGPRLWVPGAVLLLVGSVPGPVEVLRRELLASPWARTAGWPAPTTAVVVVGVVLGVLLMGRGVLLEGTVREHGASGPAEPVAA